MKTFILVASLLFINGCTVSHGVVKEVYTDGKGTVVVNKCDVKAYLAFYGLIAADENCHNETAKVIPSGQAS